MSMDVQPDDDSKILVEFREPADTTELVNSATQNLKDIFLTITKVKADNFAKISIQDEKIEEIVAALNELNSERLWLHEAVEAETIKASVLRHKLGGFPRDIEGEIRDAVRSARYSNVATIQRLKDQLTKTEANITLFQNQFSQLAVSNVTLKPEMLEMRGLHDEIIDDLNGKLLEKARMQINLNDTKNLLTDMKKKMDDYKEAFVELNEDMVEERREAEIEMERLRKEIEKAKAKTSEQRTHNLTKKAELDNLKLHSIGLQAEIEKKKEEKGTSQDVGVKNQAVHNLESSQYRLDVLLSQQIAQLKTSNTQNEELTRKGEELCQQINELSEIFTTDKGALEKEFSNLTNACLNAKDDYDLLASQKIRTTNLLDEATQSARADKDEAQEMQKSLRKVKDELLHLTADSTRFKRENAELEAIIEQTIQDHNATADILNKEIELYQDTLYAERKERTSLQQLRDDIQNESTQYKLEYNVFVTQTTKTIAEGNAQHNALNERGQVLQKTFKEAEETIKKKQKSLVKAKSGFLTMQKDLKGKTKQLKESIAQLTEEIKLKEEKYNTEFPVFEELKTHSHLKIDEYEKMKKIIVDLKMQKAELEATVEKRQEKLEAKDAPKLQVQTELSETRKDFLKQLEHQGNEVKQVEGNIYHTNYKLNAVHHQNTRFQDASNFFRSDIEFMYERIESMKEGNIDIETTINQYRDWLEKQWREHKELDKHYYDRDILMLDDIKKVEVAATERQEQVIMVHGRLENELNLLTTFIDKVADIRPTV